VKKWIKTAVLGLIALLALVGVLKSQFFLSTHDEVILPEPHELTDIPVKGMVTLLDLGAKSCIPCKMMAPIIVKVEKDYKGKAAIVFIDVWKNQEPARRFGIRAIPTQIFFDREGKEVYRHVGFMSEETIVAQLKRMGID
jgi:thioredoxin 1